MKPLPAVVTALGLAATGLAVAPSAEAAARPGRCFRISEMRGWKATPDARSLYIRVGMRDIYSVALSGACPMLNRPGVHLVNKVSNDLVCSPIEFDLRVGDTIPGFPAVPCLVDSYRLLSPEEAAALPPKQRP